MTRYTAGALLICILIYAIVSLEHLAVFPPVGQDEPWIAAAPYKLANATLLGVIEDATHGTIAVYQVSVSSEQ